MRRPEVKYLLKIDPFALMGSRRPGWPHRGGPMIKLSDVKVRSQYRTRVRYRLLVLQYAQAHGPSTAGRHYGLSARTIRRWRKRWRRSGVEGLVPAYPRHRARRVSPAAIELNGKHPVHQGRPGRGGRTALRGWAVWTWGQPRQHGRGLGRYAPIHDHKSGPGSSPRA